jgi:hypothetical protein
MTYIIIACSIYSAQRAKRDFSSTTQTLFQVFCQIDFSSQNLKKKLKALDKRDEDVELSLLEVSLPDTPSVAKLLSSSSRAIRFEEDDFARALIYRGRWWW